MKPNGDIVDHPKHYTQGDIECIQAIRAMLGDQGYLAYCRGQMLKYNWRAMYKGATETDLRKARWYTEEAVRVAEKLDTTNHTIVSKTEDPRLRPMRMRDTTRRAFAPQIYDREQPETD